MANLNPNPNPNAHANPNPEANPNPKANPNQVLVIAGCGCGALSALGSCAVLWAMLRRGVDAAGRPLALRASGSAEWD